MDRLGKSDDGFYSFKLGHAVLDRKEDRS